MKTKKSLANRYRPKCWGDVVGQDQAVSKLRGMIKSKTIPNALLITGPSGTGKTTLSRMVSSYLNCSEYTDGKSKELCGECISCKTGITTNANITETNAADSRGIDDVRALTRQFRMKPSFGAFRVFIIDEAHQLTAQSSNLLLKPIEEMVESTLVILSTTNPEKLPNALRGRCTTIQVNLPQPESIVGLLKKVITTEKWSIFSKRKDLDDILARIVAASGCQVRDSLQYLESVNYSAIDTGDLDTSISKVLVVSHSLEQKAIRALLSLYVKNSKTLISTISSLDVDAIQFITKIMYLNNYYIQHKAGVSPKWTAPENKTLLETINSKGLKVKIDPFIVGNLLVEMRKDLISFTLPVEPYLTSKFLSIIS